ncbi:putative transcriptional regulatory protein ycbL [Proteiniborus sp. DW1]|uniref:response regulator transcription factor n=1 Tax=Proteiniborus sp. DW1 TaxID=1889883 RepID=UPI00092DF48E|nr:response regulator transcription factor [Proteiniborus sp. DW1]SCG84419.1 putative transcriptional regulatory protein ycbL [Proteiniborus sp. DW1]
MNENINILVVEDDVDINNLLYKILSKEGYSVRPAFSGSEAKMCLEHYDFQLVLLDLMLPAISGEELISQIRQARTMPIIVISAKLGQDAKIEALRLGADDFISKPFDVNEVLARVEAQLRRYMVFSNTKEKQKILKYKDLVLNPETIEVRVKEKPIALTAREFAILELMMSHPNKVFTKANLFEHVWNEEFLGDDNTVNVHISNLRSKLAKVSPDTEYIKTIWGIGFKIGD